MPTAPMLIILHLYHPRSQCLIGVTHGSHKFLPVYCIEAPFPQDYRIVAPIHMLSALSQTRTDRTNTCEIIALRPQLPLRPSRILWDVGVWQRVSAYRTVPGCRSRLTTFRAEIARNPSGCLLTVVLCARIRGEHESVAPSCLFLHSSALCMHSTTTVRTTVPRVCTTLPQTADVFGIQG
jgi:hypothetical protein